MKYLIEGLAALLIMVWIAGTAEATLIHYEATNQGQVTGAFKNDGFVDDSWVSAGDQVKFSYVFDYNDSPFEMALSFQIEVLGRNGFVFSPGTSHMANSTFIPQSNFYYDYDYDWPLLYWDGITPELINPSGHIEIWDGDFSIQGHLGGGWSGSFSVMADIYDEFGNNIKSGDGSYGFSFTSEPAPEPSTMLLFGIGIAGLLIHGVRRSSRR